MAHGEFGDWADSIGIGRYQVSRFIKVADELQGAKLQTSANIGLDALYLIATMPEPERTKPHELPDGAIKTPDEMTVRELRGLINRNLAGSITFILLFYAHKKKLGNFA